VSDENVNPDSIATKPLPLPADAAAPTEPIAADLPPAAVTAVPAARPSWIAPAVIVGFFALLLVIAIIALPPLLAQRADPVPSVTPTLPSPTPTLTEEAPQQEQPTTEQPPVVVEPEPQPTEVAPEPTEPPVDPEPSPSATP
jgi:hypothetical protein